MNDCECPHGDANEPAWNHDAYCPARVTAPDGITHDGQPVVPYQCMDDNQPCNGTFDTPCLDSAAGRIVYRAATRMTEGS